MRDRSDKGSPRPRPHSICSAGDAAFDALDMGKTSKSRAVRGPMSTCPPSPGTGDPDAPRMHKAGHAQGPYPGPSTTAAGNRVPTARRPICSKMSPSTAKRGHRERLRSKSIADDRTCSRRSSGEHAQRAARPVRKLVSGISSPSDRRRPRASTVRARAGRCRLRDGTRDPRRRSSQKIRGLEREVTAAAARVRSNRAKRGVGAADIADQYGKTQGIVGLFGRAGTGPVPRFASNIRCPASAGQWGLRNTMPKAAFSSGAPCAPDAVEAGEPEMTHRRGRGKPGAKSVWPRRIARAQRKGMPPAEARGCNGPEPVKRLLSETGLVAKLPRVPAFRADWP